MKKTICVLLAALFLCALAACGAGTQTEPAETPAPAASATSIPAPEAPEPAEQAPADSAEGRRETLVAYFSATGTTEAIAKELAAVTGAKLCEIKPETAYTAEDLDWTVKTSRSSVEMQDRSSRPAIVKDLKDAGGYDTVYIGFPIWWDTAPTIINTFIETYGFKGKTVVFFATSGGSSLDKANAEFKSLYPEINWKAGKTLNRASRADIKSWVETIFPD